MATISGTSNNDHLNGTGDDDTIDGLSGQDTIKGKDGDDSIDGGQGDDYLYGGEGDDTINGGPGQDRIYGGDGDDVIFDDDAGGNKSVDTVYGGDGNDQITLRGNGDSAYGGDGNDIFNIDTDQNFNNLFIDGGEDSDGKDNDVLNLGALYEKHPNLQVIYEQGGPGDENGRILLKDGGNELGRITYRNIEAIVCFAAGTLIATARGEVPVETLTEGDKVFTRDNGLQEIRWIGRRDLGAADLLARPDWQPITVRAGALGNGMPDRDLTLSPNHRLLIASERAALHFGEREVLASAHHMTGMAGVERVAARQVSYIHMLFDQHEVVLSNGAWSESFQPGDYSLRGVGSAQRDEIVGLFPELELLTADEGWTAARQVLKRHEAKLLSA